MCSMEVPQSATGRCLGQDAPANTSLFALLLCCNQPLICSGSHTGASLPYNKHNHLMECDGLPASLESANLRLPTCARARDNHFALKILRQRRVCGDAFGPSHVPIPERMQHRPRLMSASATSPRDPAFDGHLRVKRMQNPQEECFSSVGGHGGALQQHCEV